MALTPEWLRQGAWAHPRDNYLTAGATRAPWLRLEGSMTMPFHGDILQAVRDERGVWVPLKCEALGIATDSQRRKLLAKAWATTTTNVAVACVIHATGADGKSYGMFAAHLDSLPMWLATIKSEGGDDV